MHPHSTTTFAPLSSRQRGVTKLAKPQASALLDPLFACEPLAQQSVREVSDVSRKQEGVSYMSRAPAVLSVMLPQTNSLQCFAPSNCWFWLIEPSVLSLDRVATVSLVMSP